MLKESKIPHVSIIILNWNGWRDTIECLESLYKITYPNYDVVLIDNGSEDESIEKIKVYCNSKIQIESNFFKYDPSNKPIKIIEYTREELDDRGGKEEEIADLPSNIKLTLIKNEKNYGYAEGNNIGIRYAMEALHSNYVLILNNDTVVEQDFLNHLVEVAESDDKIGIVGPKVYIYNTNRIWATGDMKHYGKVDDGKFDKILEVRSIVGCAFFIKKSVIEKVGLLDPEYFLYCEENDYCIRAAKAGYRLYYSPQSVVWHKEIFKQIKLNKAYYNGRNNIILRVKNSTGVEVIISILKYFIISYPLEIYPYRYKPAYLLLYIRGTFDGLLWWMGIKPAGKNTSIALNKKR